MVHSLTMSTKDSTGRYTALIDGLRDEVASIREEVRALREEFTPSGPNGLLTREEAAERLRISTSTLDDMADMGEIQPTRIRGRVLYHPETLDAFMRGRTNLRE